MLENSLIDNILTQSLQVVLTTKLGVEEVQTTDILIKHTSMDFMDGFVNNV